MPKNTSIKHIKSSVSGNVPTYTDLEYGELALNYTDGSLFYRDSSDNVVPIASSKDNLLSGEYAFSTATSATDPGVGVLRLNNATASIATALYIDQLSYTKANMDNAFAGLRIGDIIAIQEKSDGSNAARYRLTSGPPANNGGWWTFAVQWVDGSGSWTNSTILSVTITRISRIGTTGLLDNSVTLAKMADMATSSLIYRKTAGTGDPEVNTLATLKSDLGLTGTNSGDQTITLTGDVTGGGTGSFAATIAANAVSNTKLRDSSALSVIGRSANSTGDPADITAASSGQVLWRNNATVEFGTIQNHSLISWVAAGYAGPTDSTTWVDMFPEGTASLGIGHHYFTIMYRLVRSAGSVTSTALDMRLDSSSTTLDQWGLFIKCYTNTAASETGSCATLNNNTLYWGAALTNPSTAVTIATAVGDSTMTYHIEISGMVTLSSARTITPQIRFNTGSGYTTSVAWGSYWKIDSTPLTYGLIA